MNSNNLLGNTIREARMAKHLSQEKLSEIVEITPIHLKQIEGGRRNPSVNVLFNLATVLNFSLDKIVLEMNNCDSRTLMDFNLNFLLKQCSNSQLKLIYNIVKVIMENDQMNNTTEK